MTNSSIPPARPATIPPVRSLFRSPGFKFVVISVLTVALTVPLLFVWSLLSERQIRAGEVRQIMAGEWGGQQMVTGPILAVPYVIRRVVPASGSQPERTVEDRQTAFFLPDRLEVTADVATEVRRVAIFETPVYVAEVAVKARFDRLDRTVLGPQAVVDWPQA